MDAKVWITEEHPEFATVYKAIRHWRWNEPPGEPFEDWMERNYNCYVIMTASLSGYSDIPYVMFLTPADKTMFVLKWT